MIIGITGTFGSGKTTITNHLIKRNFKFITISDLVREKAKKQNLPIERKILQDLGNKMRKLYGKNYWAKKSLERINIKKDWIIDGIRNPGEIEEFKKIPNFILISLDAPLEVRIKRILGRKKTKSKRKYSDPNDIKEIKKLEERDRGINESPFGQQVMECIKLADYKINTNKSIKETIKIIDKILSKFKK